MVRGKKGRLDFGYWQNRLKGVFRKSFGIQGSFFLKKGKDKIYINKTMLY